MQTLALFNTNRGVGQTTLIYHLGHMLARMNERVLMVDLDPQSTLTAMCLHEDDLEALWTGDSTAARTVADGFELSRQGISDIKPVRRIALHGTLALLPGSLRLSLVDDLLARRWAHAMDGHAAAFHTLSGFHRIIQEAADEFEATLVLIDIGPNLGAINRVALLFADHVISPLAPDLFSIQGLRNLGPTLKRWREQWQKRLAQRPDDLDLPKGTMAPLGYFIMQAGMRLDRPTKAYHRWVKRIPTVYNNQMQADVALPDIEQVDRDDPACLGVVRHYHSLMAFAHDARKPIFDLRAGDGALGSHAALARRCGDEFGASARASLSACRTHQPYKGMCQLAEFSLGRTAALSHHGPPQPCRRPIMEHPHFERALRAGLFPHAPQHPDDIVRERVPFGCSRQIDGIAFEALWDAYLHTLKNPPDAAERTAPDHIVGLSLEADTAERVGQFENAQVIEYQGAAVPDAIFAMPRLRIVELVDNGIAALPAALAQASNTLEGLRLVNQGRLADLSLLAKLPYLQAIRLSNPIALTDHAPLVDLPRLTHLQLEAYDYSAGAADLARLTGLRSLQISWSERRQAASATILENMAELRALELDHAELGKAPIPRIEQLEALCLTSIEAWAPIFEAASRLEVLDLSHAYTDVLPPDLGALRTLKALNLHHAKVEDHTDFAPLGALTDLKVLWMGHGRARTAPDVLAGMALEQIDLGRRISQIEALRGHATLREANLEGVLDADHAVEIVMSMPALERVKLCRFVPAAALVDHPSLRYISGAKQDGLEGDDRVVLHGDDTWVLANC